MDVGELGGSRENATQVWWDDFLAGEVCALYKKMPSDLLFGLGHPDWKADIVYWSQMPHFTLREVVLLSVGVDPERYDDKMLSEIEKKESDRTYPAVRFVLKRHRLLRRYFPLGGVSHERMSLRDYKKLIDDIGLEVPEEWYEALLDRLATKSNSETVSTINQDASVEDAQALAVERAPEGREVASLAKLLTAIAIEEYGYNPDSRRSPIPREIQDIAARLGLSVSQDTIRKYLQVGAKYLPRDNDAED